MTRCGTAVLRAAVALSVLAGCTSEREAASGPQPGAASEQAPLAAAGEIGTVAMIGDSITVGSEDALRFTLGQLPVDLLAIDAAVGRRMDVDGTADAGLDAVARVAAAMPPDLWVVALGTNDVGIFEGEDAYRAAIEELLGALPPDAPLVWVNVYVESAPERSDEFNAVLADVLDERGRATVVDWRSRAADDGILGDGIHPSERGRRAFAVLVADGVARWLD